MHVAIQAWLPSDEPSGAWTRLLGLLRGLSHVDEARDLELTFLTSTRVSAIPQLATLASARPRTHILPLDIAPGPTWRRVMEEARSLSRKLRDLQVDVFDTQSLPMPKVSCASVLTIHDLRDLGRFRRGVRGLLAPIALRRAARRATRIIVPSPPVAEELHFHVPCARAIDVVPAGIELRTRQPQVEAKDPILLHIGRPEPRKDLPFLLEAYAAARRQRASLPPLVLVGEGCERALGLVTRSLRIAGHVQFPGVVDDDELDVLLRRAVALAFPSRLEGFGLPLLEAMARGVPCIVRGHGVPEWLVGAAGVVPAPDINAWADAMLRITEDSDLRTRLSREAMDRAAHFTLERAARLWLSSWQQACAAHGSV